MTSLKIPEVIPIFPLPETVLLPSEVLPLHIFEPRYRQMVRDALHGPRIIGMTLLHPGYEKDYEGAPGVNPVGCTGVIAQHQELPDGRFLIVLVGAQKFEIREELPAPTLYRQVRVQHLPDHTTAEERAGVQSLRMELITNLPVVLQQMQGAEVAPAELAKLDDSQLIAVATKILQLSTEEKQRILESEKLADRYVLLHESMGLLGVMMQSAKKDPTEVN